MRIAYVGAGAAGMYCGSCLHDNTLAAALMRLGHEVVLLPTYTPMRTDEEGVAVDRVFYGAVNVYLQQKAGLFRHTPRWLDRLFDRPGLLRWVSRFAGSTDARELGALTLSTLAGEGGAQSKELDKLVEWLAREVRPEVVHLSNSLFLGMARRLRQALGVPIVVSLQGEDLFLGELVEPWRGRALALLAERANDADLFIAPSRWYAAEMARLLNVDDRVLRVVPLGIRLDQYQEEPPPRPAERPPTIGYLARICPEKGLHLLVEALAQLAGEPGRESLRLRVAGYLAPKDSAWFAALGARLAELGLADRFDHVGEVDLGGKVSFLRSLDVLAVPTVYREPKGLFALEAMANGVPVVVPRHGSFPEMLEETGGGLLVEPGSTDSLAAGLSALLDDEARRLDLGRSGRAAVFASRGEEAMARATAAVLAEAVAGGGQQRHLEQFERDADVAAPGSEKMWR
ncbi:MAG TPA: glycosyltransferase family 4 protein [Thermoanaerobaculia bacterium]|nr:glycosyltransferase family 4 protein [Thermoanaerobaculia bacterium]